MSAAKKNPLEMTLGELLKEYGGAKKHESGTMRKVVAEEALPVPPSPVVDFHAKTFVDGGVKFLRVSGLPYNHTFVRGFIPYRVARDGKKWIWDGKQKSWTIPVSDLQLLVEGLKECFRAESLSVDGRRVAL